MGQIIKFVGFAFILASVVLQGDENVKIDSKFLFVPVGFDDNDEEVLVVIDGYLPTASYKIAKTIVTRTSHKGKTHISIQQTATKSNEKPFHENVVVPFSRTVSLGKLPKGSYFVQAAGVPEETELVVGEAPVKTKDNFPYASVDHVRVYVESREEIYAIVEGRMTNTCLALEAADIEVTKTGRTLQVLPKLRMLDKAPDGSPCGADESAFSVEKKLPPLEEGRFLLHVRSMDGQAHNLPFDPSLNTPAIPASRD